MQQLIRGAYARFATLLRELIKFGAVGAVAFVVKFGLVNILWTMWGSEGTLIANVIATVIATTVAYFGNRFWTFRHREQSGLAREYVLFFVFNGVGLLIELICLGFIRYTLGLDSLLANNVGLVIGTGFGTLFRFWSYKRWVFLAPPEEPAVEEAAVQGEGQAGPLTTR
ncbi:GtrA family protein [Herbidospora cretacea]|uniref:GtrA family protein n=1 Tax=Herbidospora cretacea TaxID=28444 RepID=UPI00077365D8|nr:GtrA family protein [Herbidospora cretacea]